jgi:small multidrug resistance pump
MHYFLLSVAIVIEVIGTSLLKVSDGFTRLWPSIGALLSFAAAIYLLSVVVREVPVGVAYAIWSGVGVTLITVIGWVAFDQKLPVSSIVGIGLIVIGVIVLQLFGEESSVL